MVHMGAGDPGVATRTALRHAQDYAHLREGGLLVVSTFATVWGVTVGDILQTMPHRSFATASVGAVRRHHELLPTTIIDPQMPPRLQELQAVHYDIVLPLDVADVMASVDVASLSEPAARRVIQRVEEAVLDVIALFGERHAR